MSRVALAVLIPALLAASAALAQPADQTQHGHAGHAPEAAAPPDATAPPEAPTDHAADQVFGAEDMARARRTLAAEHGGALASKVMVDLFEYQARKGADGYRWEGEAWYGGDINRAVIKTEGEGGRESGVEAAEVQALYSRAVGRYVDLQAGLRHDFEPGDARTYATVGFESVLPYWFKAEGALFLSDRGDLLGRLEGTYDLRITQRVILQPRAELNFAAQDVAATRTGSGLSTGELGLRLRYEIRREFAPYVGVSYERAFGDTADFVRAAGEDAEKTSFVVGIRTWF